LSVVLVVLELVPVVLVTVVFVAVVDVLVVVLKEVVVVLVATQFQKPSGHRSAAGSANGAQ